MKQILMICLFLLSFAGISQNNEPVNITTTEEAPGLYRLFVADRVAVIAMTGPDGLLVIDAGYQQTARQLRDALALIDPQPIGYLVNTHLHNDHTGGNQVLGQEATVIAHASVKDYLQQRLDTVNPFPHHALPDIMFEGQLRLDYNGQQLALKHLPKGHTGSDIIIHFPRSKVLVVGDLLFAGYFPYVDTGNGGDPQGYLDNVEWIINNFPDDVKVIGGHGPVFTMQQLADWHQSLQQTLQVVREAKAQGMSLEQMKSERILKEWEDFGKFFITEDQWIETLYPAV